MIRSKSIDTNAHVDFAGGDGTRAEHVHGEAGSLQPGPPLRAFPNSAAPARDVARDPTVDARAVASGQPMVAEKAQLQAGSRPSQVRVLRKGSFPMGV